MRKSTKVLGREYLNIQSLRALNFKIVSYRAARLNREKAAIRNGVLTVNLEYLRKKLLPLLDV